VRVKRNFAKRKSASRKEKVLRESLLSTADRGAEALQKCAKHELFTRSHLRTNSFNFLFFNKWVYFLS
jgi:hypothetical protein